MTNYHMHGLRHVRKLLTDDTARTVACSIAARLDTATPFYIEPRKRRCTAVQLSYNAFRTIYGGMVKPHYMNNEVNLRSVHIKKREKNISSVGKGAGTPYRRVPSQKSTATLLQLYGDAMSLPVC